MQTHDTAGGHGAFRRVASYAAFFTVPALLYACLIWSLWRYARAIPVLDDWDLLPRLERLFTGQPDGWEDVFRQFGDHWIFTATLVRAAFLWLIRDLRLETLTLIPLVTLLCWCGYALLVKTTVRERSMQCLLASFTAAGLFSWHHASHWLWPITLVYPLTNLFVIAAVLLVARRNASWITLAGAALLCSLASTTFSTGIASWIALLLLLWIRGYSTRKLLVWLGLATAALVIFAAASFTAETHPQMKSMSWFLMAPRQTLSFFLIMLGHPLSWHTAPAMLLTGLGTLLCAAGTITCLMRGPRERLQNAAPWISLWLFGLLGAGMIAAGRVRIEAVSSADSDRYMLITWVTVIALAPMLVLLAGRWRTLLHTGLTVITSLLIVQSWLNLDDLQSQSLRILRAHSCIEMPALSPESCYSAYIAPWQLRDYGASLEKIGLHHPLVLPAGAARREAVSSGSFEALERRQITVGAQSILAYGWAALEDCHLPEHVFLLTASGTVAGHARTGFPPPSSSPCPDHSGWQAVLRDDVLGSMSGQTIEAWAYDEERNALVRLQGSKIVDRTLLQVP